MAHRAPPVRISVVLPVLNEAQALPALLAALADAGVHERIVVDGGSTDGTRALAERSGARIVDSGRGRGPQQNAGARVATGDVIWFLHADTGVDPACVAALREARGEWGCFAVSIASRDARLRLTAALMNRRARRSGSCTGDMGIWVRPAFFAEIGGFAALSAFEDLDLTDRARARVRPEVLEPPLVTSARRWTREGVTRTMARMLALRAAYRVGGDPASLARRYASHPRVPNPDLS